MDIQKASTYFLPVLFGNSSNGDAHAVIYIVVSKFQRDIFVAIELATTLAASSQKPVISGAFRTEQKLFPDKVRLVFLATPGQWVSNGTLIASVRIPGSFILEVIHRLGEVIGTPSRFPSGLNVEVIDG